MMFSIVILAYEPGTSTAFLHEDYVVVGCAAVPGEGFRPPHYALYVTQTDSATYAEHTFELTRNGDAISSMTGWVCHAGYGLPALWVVDVT